MKYISVAIFALILLGCGTETKEAIPQSQTEAAAKADLDARLQKDGATPEEASRAKDELDRAMMSTQARRAPGPGAQNR